MEDGIISVEVEGLDQFAEKLDKLPFKTAQNIMRPALQASGEVFQQAAQSFAPVASQPSHLESTPGELRNSIISKVRLGKDLDSNTVKIGPNYDRAKYSGKNRTHSPGICGMFVEFGTAKMTARPFLRPAFEAAKETAVEVFGKVVGELLGLLGEDKTE